MSKERTAEEWGRVAVSLPGWRWMPGMLALRTTHPVVVERGAPTLIPVRLMGSITEHEEVAGITLHGELLEAGHVVVNGWHRSSDLIPDPDDPCTAGGLLALLGPYADEVVYDCGMWTYGVAFDTLGRACIAAAAAIGRWPGGEE